MGISNLSVINLAQVSSPVKVSIPQKISINLEDLKK
jgi:hypothetical protein